MIFRADVTATNRLGQTAYDIAYFWNHANTMDVLRPSTEKQREPVYYFTTSALNRASERRKDRKWLLHAQSDSRTNFYVFVKGFSLIQMTKDGMKLRRYGHKEIETLIQNPSCEVILLGVKTEGAPIFALSLKSGRSYIFLSAIVRPSVHG